MAPVRSSLAPPAVVSPSGVNSLTYPAAKCSTGKFTLALGINHDVRTANTKLMQQHSGQGCIQLLHQRPGQEDTASSALRIRTCQSTWKQCSESSLAPLLPCRGGTFCIGAKCTSADYLTEVCHQAGLRC